MRRQIIICFRDEKIIHEIDFFDTDKEDDILDDIKQLITKKLKIDCNSFFLLSKSDNKLITKKNILEYLIQDKLVIDVIVKLKGGLIDGIVKMLAGIIKMFEALGKIITEFVRMIENLFDLIPVIFDPPKLIDDIMFAVSFGLNKMFSVMMGSTGGLASSPEDDTGEQGPLGIDSTYEKPIKCIDPTFTTILLLIICPPLAILMKLGFWAGFISSIICGVLCVRLYYFPGLLFAILHVLC